MEHSFVEVEFLYGFKRKKYFFKNGHEGIEVGDTVLVDTVHGLQVAKVTGLPETVARNVGKWVAAKVDLTRFNEIMQIRAEEKQAKFRKQELKRDMRVLFESTVMEDMMEKFAEENEEMAKMKAEYDNL